MALRPQLLFLSFLTLLFSSCAYEGDSGKNIKTNNLNNGGGRPAVQDKLSGKSAAEILKIKYDEAILKCRMWIQQSEQIDTTVNAIEEFSFDLKSSGDLAKPLLLRLPQVDDHQLAGQQIEINLNFSAVTFENVSHKDQTGISYKMSYSPVLRYTFNYRSVVQLADRSVSFSGVGAGSVLERIASPSVNFVTSSADPLKSFHNLVVCAIDTKIKKEFEDQFLKIEEPGPVEKK